MPFKKDTACVLLQASNLAYAIDYAPGAVQTAEVLEGISAIGFNPASLKHAIVTAADVDACFLVTNETAAILAFRGTLPPDAFLGSANFFQVLADWLNDGRADLVVGASLPGKVHKGFLGSLNHLWPDIQTWLADPHVNGKPLYITGHSKGGGLSYLAATRCAATPGVTLAGVYTYAAPRVGDTDFVAGFNALLGEVWRIEYQDDIVPHLPPETGGWLKAIDALGALIPETALSNAPPATRAALNDLLTSVRSLTAAGPTSYASAGNLEFIDWDCAIESDHPGLKLQRNLSLAKALIFPRRIIQDHLVTSYSAGIGCWRRVA